MKTGLAPSGIVSLQLAFTPTQARAVVLSWRHQHLDGAAKRSLAIDLGFIIAYAWTLGLLATLAARAAAAEAVLSPSDSRTFAAALVLAGWTAAFTDILENGGLWLEIKGHLSTPITVATSTISAIKWFLAIASALASLALLIASALSA